MDLAESILNELVTLQKKNEELVGIITRLEHESDVIIRQFEEKIADLHKKLKKIQDNVVKSEKKYDVLVRESKKECENFEKEKENLITEFSGKISGLDSIIKQYSADIVQKDEIILALTEEKNHIQSQYLQESEIAKEKISRYLADLENEREKSRSEIDILSSEYKKQVSELQDQVVRKETELRALASELKTKIAFEKDAIREKKKSEKTLADLTIILDSERNARKKLESDYTIESDRFLKIIDDLNYQLADVRQSGVDIQNDLQSRIDKLSEEKERLLQENDTSTQIIAGLEEESKRVRENNDLNLADLAEKIQEIERLHRDLEFLRTDYDSRISDLIHKNKNIQTELEGKILECDTNSREMEIQRVTLESKILALKNDNDNKDHELSQSSDTIFSLESELGEVKKEYQESVSLLKSQVKELKEQELLFKKQAEERESADGQKISELESDIQHLQSELKGFNDFIRQKEEREQEFRVEITHLHEELVKRTDEWKELLDRKSRDLAEKDRHITLISGNNEALRSELERIRSRLLLLEKTIREDNEEPVHALYRQIQNLSTKLAGKESENSLLASRITRLDTENTRLTELLTESELSFHQNGTVEESGIQTVYPGRKDLQNSPDISEFLLNLDDPLQAMQAADEILHFGQATVDTLIPMLYRGSINRRAWIAVLLYELNDPRATKPLSDLLESSESGLRELIWDTRIRFREWRRSGIISTVAQ